MKNIGIILLGFLVSVSYQRFDIKSIYELSPPIHEWNKTGSASVLESEKEINSFIFSEPKIGVVWNSYKISEDDDFLISFDYIIDNLVKINTKIDKIFQIFLTSTLHENGVERKKIDENFGKISDDLIGFELDLIKNKAKGIFNISFIKNSQGQKMDRLINEVHPIVCASKIKKNNNIKIQIKIINKKLIFKINDKEIIKNEEINNINKLLAKQKIYISLITFGTSTSKLIIKNFKLIKIIKPYALTYNYNLINNNLNTIIIKIKDKYNKNISINALKNMECYFDKSYIKEGIQKYYFQQFFKDDSIELIPNEKINYINKNYIFIPVLKCLNNDEKEIFCEGNVCYFEVKEKKKHLRKLEEKERIIITVNGNKNDKIDYLYSKFFEKNIPDEVYLNKIKIDNSTNQITLTQDGDNAIEVCWKKKLNSLEQMFYRCSSLVSIDLSNIDTSNVNSTYSMFYGCSSLKSLNLSNFNTENVKDMNYMFYYCSSLTSLNLSNFNTENVDDMGGIFGYCSSLISLDLSNFNTKNVENMNNMFQYCSNLISLNLSNFNTENVKDMNYMFYQCSSLISLNLSNFNTENVFSMAYMFSQCNSLTSLNLSNFNTKNVYDMKYMFNGCSSITSLNLSNFITENVQQMSVMFGGCYSLISLDLSSFNTENVQQMNVMFADCSSLLSLNLSNFNTGKVNNILYMFSGCSSLKSLNLSNFNTENVQDMNYLFAQCSSLTSLDLSNLKTSNVTQMSRMFWGCSSLESINLGSFNTENIKDMSYMFSDCISLKSLNLSNFITSKELLLDYMFSNCTSLLSLDLSNFIIERDAKNVFLNSYKLQYLNLLNYRGNDIFDSLSNFDILTICIKDFMQINNGNNALFKKNVKILCDENKNTTIEDTIPETIIENTNLISIESTEQNTNIYTIPVTENTNVPINSYTLIFILGFDSYTYNIKNKSATFNCYFSFIMQGTIPKIIYLYLIVNYKRNINLEPSENIKSLCNLVDDGVKDLIKYECEFATNGEEISNVMSLDIIEIDSQKIEIGNFGFLYLENKNNIQNAQDDALSKNLYFLEDSVINSDGKEFNITGNLEVDEFNYNKLLLQFHSDKNNTKTLNSNCLVIKSSEKKYILRCTPDNPINTKIIDGYSHLGDGNLIIKFKKEENEIEMQPSKTETNKDNYNLLYTGSIAIVTSLFAILLIVSICGIL